MCLANRRAAVCAVGIFLLSAASSVRGVVLRSTHLRYTNPPASCWLAGSGWQWQGQWGAYLGAAIAPSYFITAKHVAGSVGGYFSYNGQSYKTINSFASPAGDLRIFQVQGTFSSYAPLYTRSDELGGDLVVIGRGWPRGDPVVVEGQTKGWLFGPGDGLKSWGTNRVSGIDYWGSDVGSLLAFAFDANGGDYFEAHLAPGDSGGGAFIRDGNVWKLAGIHYAIDGPYSLTGQDGSGFLGAIVDQGGLYVGGDGRWTLIPDGPQDVPASSYATRISSNITWISSIVGPVGVVPEPATAWLLLAAWCFPRRRHPAGIGGWRGARPPL